MGARRCRGRGVARRATDWAESSSRKTRISFPLPTSGGADGRRFAGIVYAHQLGATVGQIVAELQLILEASSADELRDSRLVSSPMKRGGGRGAHESFSTACSAVSPLPPPVARRPPSRPPPGARLLPLRVLALLPNVRAFLFQFRLMVLSLHLFDVHRRLGKPHPQRFERLRHDPRHREVAEPFVVGGNHRNHGACFVLVSASASS